MIAIVVLAILAQAPTPPPPTIGGRPGTPGTVALLKVEAPDACVVDLYVDLDALLVGGSAAAPTAQRLAAMESLRSGGRSAESAAIERLSEMLRRRLRIRFDGVAAAFVVEYPERRATGAGELATLGAFARLRARVPAEARAVTFFASRSFRFIDLRATLGGRAARQLLEPGEESAPISLR